MYSVVNRGNGDVAPDSAGHVWLVSGWQGDVRPTPTNQTVEVPTAVNADGSPIVGLALARFSDLAPGTTTVTVATPRDPVRRMGRSIGRRRSISAPPRSSRSRQRRRPDSNRVIVTIPRAEWAFADCRTVPFPGTPDRTRVCLKGGFDPARLYQLVYTAQDPLVLGAGLAATRDLVSYLRYDRASREPRGRDGPPCRVHREFPVRELHQDVHSSRLQRGSGRPDRLGRCVSENRRPPDADELQVRASRRRGVALRARKRRRAHVGPVQRHDAAAVLRPACWIAARPRRRARRSSRHSGRRSSGACACRPDSSERTPRPMFRCRPTCGASTTRARLTVEAAAASASISPLLARTRPAPCPRIRILRAIRPVP